MFTFHQSPNRVVLLLYVDDIILTGNTDSLLQLFISTLAKQVKDLGTFHYFWGIEVTSQKFGWHLSRKKYTLDLNILDLLRCSNMVDCKPTSIPVSKSARSPASDGKILQDSTEYCHIVGALQYLTLTQPDIAFAVSHASQVTTSSTFSSN